LKTLTVFVLMLSVSLPESDRYSNYTLLLSPPPLLLLHINISLYLVTSLFACIYTVILVRFIMIST